MREEIDKHGAEHAPGSHSRQSCSAYQTGVRSLEKQFLSIDEFVQAYGLSRSGLYRLWQEGQGPTSISVGRRRMIPIEAALAWAKSMEEEAA